MNGIAEAAAKAGQQILDATEETFHTELLAGLSQFIGWPFTVGPGTIVDSYDASAGPFASLVHMAKPGGRDPGLINADSVAAAVEAYETIDLVELRAAYARIAQCKRLKKSAAPKTDPPTTNVTLGIIFARRSSVPIEELAEELERLNAATPHREWADMVVVAQTGTIHYAAQFPGVEELGLFLPPAEGALLNYGPPMYVVMVMKPASRNAFNQMMALLVGHLAIFSPGARIPVFNELLKGVLKAGIVFTGYQCNLQGDMRPVPRQFYNDRYLPALPIRIESPQKELLATIEFLPWQDGGVLLLKGKLPLDGLMIFLGAEALKKAGVVRPPGSDLQISYVLPIGEANFREMLRRIQTQSNMIVRPTEPTWTVQKLADEGSSSPFMARLYAGMPKVRDFVYAASKRDDFDKPYEFVLSSLTSARSTAKELTQLWNDHVKNIASGKAARLRGKTIHVEESIDKELRKEVESFINAAARALKQGAQNLGNELGVNIGFMFKQQPAFEAGIAAVKTNDPALADYLAQTRAWSERLIEVRNDIEHKNWTLPRIVYSQSGSGIVATEPQICKEPLTIFIDSMLDRLCCFVEEFTTHCLQSRMPTTLTLTELPTGQRASEFPLRFRITFRNGGLLPWRIAYHSSRFEDV